MSTKNQIEAAIDKALLQVLEGRDVLDQKTGEVVKLPPTAKDIEAAMKRVQQLGGSELPLPDSDGYKLIERAKDLKLTGTDGPLGRPIEDFDDDK